jgi:Tfp pilus assembly protein PilO
MKKPERKQIYIGAAAIVLIAAFALLLYRPLHGKILQVRNAKAQQLEVERDAFNKQQNLPVMREKLIRTKKETGEFGDRIPADRQLGQLLQSIAEAMNSHRLKDQVVAPGSEVSLDKLNCIPVRMQCSGSMKQIFAFFRTLEGLERIIKIEQVQLKNNADLSGVVSMNALASVYYQGTK